MGCVPPPSLALRGGDAVHTPRAGAPPPQLPADIGSSPCTMPARLLRHVETHQMMRTGWGGKGVQGEGGARAGGACASLAPAWSTWREGHTHPAARALHPPHRTSGAGPCINHSRAGATPHGGVLFIGLQVRPQGLLYMKQADSAELPSQTSLRQLPTP